MKTIIPFVVILALAYLGGSSACLAQNAKPEGQSTGQHPSNERRVSITLGGKTIHAVVADQEKTLLEGLLGWDRITDEEGMLLDFGRSGQYAIHMQGMKFPIDALWIDASGVVKLIYEQIQPNSGRIYPSVYSCRYCLEIQSGFCKRYGVKEGDKIRLR
ncbi:MAG: DUF192 domain-containing protein [Desulfomonilaceae bacterium]